MGGDRSPAPGAVVVEQAAQRAATGTSRQRDKDIGTVLQEEGSNSERRGRSLRSVRGIPPSSRREMLVGTVDTFAAPSRAARPQTLDSKGSTRRWLRRSPQILLTDGTVDRLPNRASGPAPATARGLAAAQQPNAAARPKHSATLPVRPHHSPCPNHAPPRSCLHADLPASGARCSCLRSSWRPRFCSGCHEVPSYRHRAACITAF